MVWRYDILKIYLYELFRAISVVFLSQFSGFYSFQLLSVLFSCLPWVIALQGLLNVTDGELKDAGIQDAAHRETILCQILRHKQRLDPHSGDTHWHMQAHMLRKISRRVFQVDTLHERQDWQPATTKNQRQNFTDLSQCYQIGFLQCMVNALWKIFSRRFSTYLQCCDRYVTW